MTNKQEKLKQLAYTTQPDIITIQDIKLTTTSKTPKITNYTPIRTDRVVKLGGRLLTYIFLFCSINFHAFLRIGHQKKTKKNILILTVICQTLSHAKSDVFTCLCIIMYNFEL